MTLQIKNMEYHVSIHNLKTFCIARCNFGTCHNWIITTILNCFKYSIYRHMNGTTTKKNVELEYDAFFLFIIIYRHKFMHTCSIAHTYPYLNYGGMHKACFILDNFVVIMVKSIFIRFINTVTGRLKEWQLKRFFWLFAYICKIMLPCHLSNYTNK